MTDEIKELDSYVDFADAISWASQATNALRAFDKAAEALIAYQRVLEEVKDLETQKASLESEIPKLKLDISDKNKKLKGLNAIFDEKTQAFEKEMAEKKAEMDAKHRGELEVWHGQLEAARQDLAAFERYMKERKLALASQESEWLTKTAIAKNEAEAFLAKMTSMSG